MKHTLHIALAAGLLSLAAGAAFAPVAIAQAPQQAYGGEQPRQPAFTQQDLDEMLAPIALYPDVLLMQILMAATYPLEVVEAARRSRAHPELTGEQALNAAAGEDWDASVKSLLAFPQILAIMEERLEWTKRLGDAFLDQEPHVMDTVQRLRQRAQAAGNLASDDQIRIAQQDAAIIIEPAHPQLVYVPYYDPVVIYGTWWWPALPVRWAPWWGYHRRPGAGLFWGRGSTISTRVLFGHFNWARRRIDIVGVHRAERGANALTRIAPVTWQHDPSHRRGVPYRRTSVPSATGLAQNTTAPAPRVSSFGGMQRARPELRSGVSVPVSPRASTPAQPAAAVTANRTAPARAEFSSGGAVRPRPEFRNHASPPANPRADTAPQPLRESRRDRHERASVMSNAPAAGLPTASGVRSAPAVPAPAVTARAAAPQAPQAPARTQSSKDHRTRERSATADHARERRREGRPDTGATTRPARMH